jgi:hypothetical protein
MMNDARISACLEAYKAPILFAEYYFEPFDSSPEAERIKNIISDNILNQNLFSKFIFECTTQLEY